MSLLLHIIVTYIKENIITKLYSPPRNPKAGNKSPALFVKKTLCTGDLSHAHKIFIERPEEASQVLSIEPSGNKLSTAIKCFILPRDN